MKRICKRLLLLLATLGAGALAYALLRAEGERVLRRPEREPAAGAAPKEPAGAAGGAAETGPRRCAAVTASGKPCGREPQPGSQYCWQHGG
jgi:hypothetical protein